MKNLSLFAALLFFLFLCSSVKADSEPPTTSSLRLPALKRNLQQRSYLDPPARSSFENQHHNSFLSRRWLGGMCRGGLHVLSAPLLVPTSIAYGAAMPFTSNPEQAGGTNYFLYAAAQIFTFPLTLAANTGVGAGGCCLEIFKGLFDIVSLGNFDLPNENNIKTYDSRPYFIQITGGKEITRKAEYSLKPVAESDDKVQESQQQEKDIVSRPLKTAFL